MVGALPLVVVEVGSSCVSQLSTISILQGPWTWSAGQKVGPTPDLLPESLSLTPCLCALSECLRGYVLTCPSYTAATP